MLVDLVNRLLDSVTIAFKVQVSRVGNKKLRPFRARIVKLLDIMEIFEKLFKCLHVYRKNYI